MRWMSLSLLLLAACAAAPSRLHDEIDAWGKCAAKCQDTGDDLAAHAKCEHECANALPPGPTVGDPGEDLQLPR